MRFVYCLIFGVIAAVATAQPAAPVTPKTTPSAAKQLELRNNAASLLYQLLGDEQGVHYVLLIKGHREQLQQIIKQISTTAAEGIRQIDALAKADPTLNLHALDLPAGEKATRDTIETTKEHELLFTSGADFEFTLLLTQTDALSYGWHLAQIVADNSSDPAQVKEFTALSASLQDLYKQAVALMRSPPK